MNTLPIRLVPGQDLREGIQREISAHGCSAAFVLSGIGSLSQAALRLAGATQASLFAGDLEILTLAGSVASNGIHLHASIAGSDGRVTGGHVAPGCVVRTTAEVLLMLLPEWTLTREYDAATAFDELVIRGIRPADIR